MEYVNLSLIQEFLSKLPGDFRVERISDVKLSGGVLEVHSLAATTDNLAGLVDGTLIVKKTMLVQNDLAGGEEDAEVGVEEAEPAEGSPPSDNEEVAEVVES